MIPKQLHLTTNKILLAASGALATMLDPDHPPLEGEARGLVVTLRNFVLEVVENSPLDQSHLDALEFFVDMDYPNEFVRGGIRLIQGQGCWQLKLQGSCVHHEWYPTCGEVSLLVHFWDQLFPRDRTGFASDMDDCQLDVNTDFPFGVPERRSPFETELHPEDFGSDTLHEERSLVCKSQGDTIEELRSLVQPYEPQEDCPPLPKDVIYDVALHGVGFCGSGGNLDRILRLIDAMYNACPDCDWETEGPWFAITGFVQEEGVSGMTAVIYCRDSAGYDFLELVDDDPGVAGRYKIREYVHEPEGWLEV